MCAENGMEKKKMALSEKKRITNDRYIKKAIVQFNMKINRFTDADVLEYVNGIENKRAWFLQIVRKEIAEQKAKAEQPNE